MESKRFFLWLKLVYILYTGFTTYLRGYNPFTKYQQDIPFLVNTEYLWMLPY